MHDRLKQRLLNYMCIFFTLMCFGKLYLRDNSKVNDHQHVVGDSWSLNEHEIQTNLDKEYNRLRRNHAAKKPAGNVNSEDDEDDGVDYGAHKLAIIVPYRNRFEELKDFVPHMKKYLKEKKIRNHIYIINQADNHRFNRASLINVGHTIAYNDKCDYMAMHDVDLLPLNKQLNYGYPELGPFHVAGPNLHPKYHYEKFVGGILILTMTQFNELNGMSNKFWGWGREDDEFYMRMVDSNYKIFRHGSEITTGYNTFKHEHSVERKRDYAKLPGQKKSMFSRDHDTGLSTLVYNQKKRSELTIDGYPCTVIDVELECDKNLTPWCDVPPAKKKRF